MFIRSVFSEIVSRKGHSSLVRTFRFGASQPARSSSDDYGDRFDSSTVSQSAPCRFRSLADISRLWVQGSTDAQALVRLASLFGQDKDTVLHIPVPNTDNRLILRKDPLESFFLNEKGFVFHYKDERFSFLPELQDRRFARFNLFREPGNDETLVLNQLEVKGFSDQATPVLKRTMLLRALHLAHQMEVADWVHWQIDSPEDFRMAHKMGFELTWDPDLSPEASEHLDDMRLVLALDDQDILQQLFQKEFSYRMQAPSFPAEFFFQLDRQLALMREKVSDNRYSGFYGPPEEQIELPDNKPVEVRVEPDDMSSLQKHTATVHRKGKTIRLTNISGDCRLNGEALHPRRFTVQKISVGDELAVGSNVYRVRDNRLDRVSATADLYFKLFENGLNQLQIRQNNIGDCYFLSSEVQLARMFPHVIADSIEENPDSSFNVNYKLFPDFSFRIEPQEIEDGEMAPLFEDEKEMYPGESHITRYLADAPPGIQLRERAWGMLRKALNWSDEDPALLENNVSNWLDGGVDADVFAAQVGGKITSIPVSQAKVHLGRIKKWLTKLESSPQTCAGFLGSRPQKVLEALPQKRIQGQDVIGDHSYPLVSVSPREILNVYDTSSTRCRVSLAEMTSFFNWMNVVQVNERNVAQLSETMALRKSS